MKPKNPFLNLHLDLHTFVIYLVFIKQSNEKQKKKRLTQSNYFISKKKKEKKKVKLPLKVDDDAEVASIGDVVAWALFMLVLFTNFCT